MPSDRWQRVKELIGSALERPAAAREAFLREACGGDEGLRREVDSLLAAQRDAGEFLSRPARLDVSSSGRLASGTRLGPYEIASFLGAGGMGEVYKARDTRLGRDVAIKVLPADFASDPDLRKRFEREARTISSLNHPHICALYDVGEHDGSSFLVMEYLEGDSLADRLSKGRLPLEEALSCATQIAEALLEAHQHDIVHRDLKPANVVLTKKGAKLLDFGIAKLRSSLPAEDESTRSRALTGAGLIIGTLQYMAPEQLEGKAVDARTDVFAFGLVLYEMVTGKKAFEGTSQPGLIAAILKGEPAPLSHVQPLAPPSLEALVQRCLAKDPSGRWSSAGELLGALRRLEDGSRPATGSGSVSASLVRAQLQRVLSSSKLVRAERLTRLLRFIVEETLEGRGDQLKEARLGLEVFQRPSDSYDPALDPIVRVQMGRLRARLLDYYDSAGANDPILIEVPKGGYVPSFRARAAGSRGAAAAEAGPPAPLESRLAVLPFVNMSPERDNEYFSDGLTEELINLLARDRSLHLVARTSTFQFKGKARDVREIGRQLEVDRLLEGSVRRSGNRVRVTAQLIGVADGRHLWSERYEREITEIFAIQDEIAGAIQRALRSRLVDAQPARSRVGQTRQLDAYNHYLQGRFLWNRRTEQGLRAAIGHFDQAIRLDPRYARAHSGLADCHLLLGMSAAEAPARCMPEARAAAMRALELDDGLAEAHASLAAAKTCYAWDRRGAELDFKRSLGLDPSYATVHHWYGLFFLASAGRLAEATDQLERAIDLDPLSQPIIADLGFTLALCGELDAAVDQCRRALELDPHFHRPHWFLGLSQAWRGDFAAAEEALKTGLELCPGAAFRSRLMGALGYCYAAWGKRERASSVIDELSRLAATGYVPRFELAQIHAGLGDTDSALACLEHVVETRESYAIFLNVWPSFAPLRSEQRFRSLLPPLGLA